tara:strand:+ start:165 stop:668 length:504 start_codon:yes stop_codon:yes gene_type:complete
MNKLHPGAKWQFRIGGYFLFGFLGIFLGIWIIAPLAGLFLGLVSSSDSILPIVLFSIFGYFPFVIIVSEIYARMSYNRWFYEFTDEGLRLERGIIWKRYSNVPYERIQNVDVHRGIIARMLGFSSVMIQTAGFSGSARAEGNIPAIEVKRAEEIRNFVMKKITSRRR